MIHRCLAAAALALALSGCETAPPAEAPQAGTAAPDTSVPRARTPSRDTAVAPGSVKLLPALKPGDYQHSVNVSSTTRHYAVHIPPGYEPGHPLPVVMVLHGRGGSAVAARSFGFSEMADHERYIVVYPEAVPPARMWYTGLESGKPAADDVAYIAMLLTDLATLVNVDAKRVYAVGYSNGGTLAAHLAGALSGRIAAIATVDSNIAIKEHGAMVTVAPPVKPVSALFLHGRADRAAPFAGGASPVLNGSVAVSAREGVTWWARAMGCSGTPRIARTGGLERQQYTGCRGGATVQLAAFAGGHDWPQSLPLDLKRIARPVDYIMDFFRASTADGDGGEAGISDKTSLDPRP